MNRPKEIPIKNGFFGMPVYEINRLKSQKEVGEFISRQRKLKGMNIFDFSDLIIASDRTIEAWEQGKNYPSKESLVSLSKALNIPIKDIISTSIYTENYLHKLIFDFSFDVDKDFKFYRLLVANSYLFEELEMYNEELDKSDRMRADYKHNYYHSDAFYINDYIKLHFDYEKVKFDGELEENSDFWNEVCWKVETALLPTKGGRIYADEKSVSYRGRTLDFIEMIEMIVRIIKNVGWDEHRLDYESLFIKDVAMILLCFAKCEKVDELIESFSKRGGKLNGIVVESLYNKLKDSKLEFNLNDKHDKNRREINVILYDLYKDLQKLSYTEYLESNFNIDKLYKNRESIIEDVEIYLEGKHGSR